MAVIIFGLMAPIVPKSSPPELTKREILQIGEAVSNYKLYKKTVPPASDNQTLFKALTTPVTIHEDNTYCFLNIGALKFPPSQGRFVDAWGTPLRISQDNSSQITIQSAGPDLLWNTADDITLPDLSTQRFLQ